MMQRAGRTRSALFPELMAYAAYWVILHGGVLLDGHLPSRFAAFCPCAVSKFLKSHSGTTPKPAAPVAHFEQQKSSAGSNMASKPSPSGSDASATGSTAKSNLSGPDVTLFSPRGWSKSGSTAAQAKTTAAASVSKPSPPKDSTATKTATAASAAKASTAAATSTAKSTATPTSTAKSTATPTSTAKSTATPTSTAKSTATPTSTAKSTATPTSTASATVTTITAAQTSTAATKAEPKVQVEVPAKAPESKQTFQTGLPLDPLDLLASSLPTEAPKRPEPKYSGPEITEGVTSEEGVRVGEREDTLPPGYRLQDMPPVPADYKPPEPAKPLSDADALDLLSDDFMCDPPQTKVETISAASKAPSNFAPAPAPTKKPESVAPPADKKAKLDSDLFSLSAAVPKASAVDQKTKMAACKADSGAKSPSGDMSLDALSALGGLLPSAAAPEPQPALRPEDIVAEATVEEEEAVRVGEREDTLPPEYRLKPGEAGQLPAPKPQPSLDTTEALDILSGDFCGSSSAPSTQTKQKEQPLSPAPPLDKKPRMETDGFSLEAGLTPSTAQKVESALPPTKKSAAKLESKAETKPCSKPEAVKPAAQVGLTSPSCDALSALGDLLPSAEPPKPQPALRPEDIVSEATVEEEEAVRVGEREDTLPPEYRLKPGEIAQLPAPKPQPSLDTTEALDILSGDFCDSSSAPSTKTVQPTAPPAESLSALDSLSLDFVTPSKGASVQAAADPGVKAPQKSAAAPVSAEKKPEAKKPSGEKTKECAQKPAQGGLTSPSSDALSALGDLLPSAEPPKPEPALTIVDIITEDPVEEEEAVRVGEREDTLPPEYRLKPEEMAQLPAPKPQPSLDTTEALDILSGDFCGSSSAPSTKTSAPSKTQLAADSALDALSGDFVSSSSAPSTQTAADAALDALSGDFMAPSAAPTVQSSSCAPDDPLGAGADSALDALSDVLKDIAPTPQPEPAMPTHVVTEKTIEEERLIKMGERDDTLPPEYRPTEEELKKMKEEKNKVPESPKEKAMDDKTALDLLAGDFSSCPAPAASSAQTKVSSSAQTKVSSSASAPVSSSASAPVSSSASAPVSSSAPASEPQKPMSGAVLDSLSETLLLDAIKKTEKAKAKSKSRSRTKKSPAEGAADLLSSQLSSDVLPSSKS